MEGDDAVDSNVDAKECYNGCNKYNKSMDEIVKAASKHREAALALKTIGMNQKSKLAGYKEQVVNMQAQIDKLEFENDAGKETIDKLSKDNKVVEEKLKTANESDEKLINKKDELQLEVKSFKDGKCKKN